MRVVVITGSRDWQDREPIERVLEGAQMVVHGWASGADSIAHEIATARGIERRPFRVPAGRWRAIGDRAGPERNERMARYAAQLIAEGHDVRCYAFPLPSSRGTWDCASRMRKHGVLVTVYGHEQEREVR
jgi:hypothetical protein